MLIEVYTSDIYSSYNGDDNISTIEITEECLFNWFKENVISYFRNEHDNKGISDRGLFDEWLDEYLIDETVGLYDYAVCNGGLVRIVEE